MTRKDYIHKLLRSLMKRRDALRSVLAGNVSTLKHQAVGDLMDLASDSVHEELESLLAAVETRELADIENALERIRTGQYGACERCGKNITFARLQAVPHALLCVHCQRRAETTGTSSDASAGWPLVDTSNDTNQKLTIEDVEHDMV